MTQHVLIALVNSDTLLRSWDVIHLVMLINKQYWSLWGTHIHFYNLSISWGKICAQLFFINYTRVKKVHCDLNKSEMQRKMLQ